ncbi:hypothetical protein NBRC116188_26690 [Oceaniserpentilla sp. 4NH20-0058]|uniref:hypothetical protein n=1 Tax=Oceaniserpentilla sp. 4NH20-0058 TaxID=3127660 RepID=UPI003101E9C9
MLLNKNQLGIAMIEVMVTVLIVTIAVSGMGLMLLRGIQATQDSSQKSQAMWIVEDYVGRMRANQAGARGGFYALNPEDIDCEAPPTQLCAETYEDGIHKGADDCSIDEAIQDKNKMATFDKWISTCGLSPSIYDSPSDFILNPRLTSRCTKESDRTSNYTGNKDCIQYSVSLKWQTRLKQVAKEEDDDDEEKEKEKDTNVSEYTMVVRFN